MGGQRGQGRVLASSSKNETDEAVFQEYRPVDPAQALPEWEDVIYEVELEVELELMDEQRFMGFCHRYWSAKMEKPVSNEPKGYV